MPYRDALATALEYPGLAALGRFSTSAEAGKPPGVRAMDLFGHAATDLKLPLNRKTTANTRVEVPLEVLEPTRAFTSVAGLASYVVRPRRDPPDVAHVVMRDGRERYVIQEGHTRLGAAKLRGEDTYDCRLWEFEEDATGQCAPVPRGLHARGLAKTLYRDKLDAYLLEWDESLHPRDEQGRFGSGGVTADAHQPALAPIRQDIEKIGAFLDQHAGVVQSATIVGSWAAQNPARMPDRRGEGTSDIDVMLEETGSVQEAWAVAAKLEKAMSGGRQVHINVAPANPGRAHTVVWRAKHALSYREHLAYLLDKDEHGYGSYPRGERGMEGRDKSNADLRKTLKEFHAGISTGTGASQLDVSAYSPADRIELVRQFMQTDTHLFASSFEDNEALKAEAKTQKWDAAQTLEEGLKRGVYSETKTDTHAFIPMQSGTPFTNVFEGVPPAQRDDFETHFLDAIGTSDRLVFGSIYTNNGSHHAVEMLTKAGWSTSDLERFSDKAEAAGADTSRLDVYKQGPEGGPRTLDRVANELAFHSKNLATFERAAYSGWTHSGDSTASQLLRNVGATAFPQPEGVEFYQPPAVRDAGPDHPPNLYSPRAVEHMTALKQQTEKFYAKQIAAGKTVDVLRSVSGLRRAYTPGSLEPWTTSKETLKYFGELTGGGENPTYSVLKTTVKYSDLLWTYKSAAGRPGMPAESELPGKQEFVVLGNAVSNVQMQHVGGKAGKRR